MFALRFPVAEIPEGESDFGVEIPPEDIDLKPRDAVFNDPISVSVVSRRYGSELTLRTRVTTGIGLICSRCLKRFDYPFDSTFTVYINLGVGSESFTAFDDEDFAIIDRNSGLVDLAYRVRAELVLGMPQMPLCDPECPGIEYPGKAEKAADSRWEALETFRSSVEKRHKGKRE